MSAKLLPHGETRKCEGTRRGECDETGRRNDAANDAVNDAANDAVNDAANDAEISGEGGRNRSRYSGEARQIIVASGH